jgi:hypothetical protein
VQQHRGHRAVDPAGQAANNLAVADLGADALHGLGAEGGHGPVAGQARDLVGEVAQDERAAWGVRHLRMELHAIEPAALVGDHREGRAFRRRRDLEARRVPREAIYRRLGRLRTERNCGCLDSNSPIVAYRNARSFASLTRPETTRFSIALSLSKYVLAHVFASSS